MVTMNSAEQVLKSVYLDVVSNQLNTEINPLFAKIKQSTEDVWGKEVIKLAPFGINGGIGAGSEDGNLPTAYGNNYIQFKSDLKNLYGQIELSDKAIRASENSTGAFVNLLNSEMEGLIKASAFNMGRMLYGDGSGVIGKVNYAVAPGKILMQSSINMIEGLVVDFINPETSQVRIAGTRILGIDGSTVYVTGSAEPEDGDLVVVQGSYNKEITGLGAIFKKNSTLYGVDRAANAWMNPQAKEVYAKISEGAMQEAIDYLEDRHASTVDFIVCSSEVKRTYQELVSAFRRNVDILELQGGYKALTYNGIPVVSDRFVDKGTMYLLNTKEFKIHQLCDWKWLENESGRILRQNPGKPTYSATLVKYAELICNKPCGQAMLSKLIY